MITQLSVPKSQVTWKNMEIKFEGKIALVTGAGRGIGRGIAEELARCGAKTYGLEVSKENIEVLKKEAPDIHIVQVDLSDWSATRQAVEQIGPVDLLVNNAGIAILEPFLDVSPENIDKSVNVNIKAAFNVSQVVAQSLIKRKQPGAIVNISSQASVIAIKNHASYCCSKAALDGLTRAMAFELAPYDIRVNCVNPTVVMTDMGRKNWSDPAKAGPMLRRIPLNRFAEVQDVVNAVMFLLSDKAAMTTGSILPTDGGTLCC